MHLLLAGVSAHTFSLSVIYKEESCFSNNITFAWLKRYIGSIIFLSPESSYKILFQMEMLANLTRTYDAMWEKRDKRMDHLPLMGSPIPTMIICATYVYIVKVAGPNYMANRKPMEIKSFLIFYNMTQVILSTYIFVEVIRNNLGLIWSLMSFSYLFSLYGVVGAGNTVFSVNLWTFLMTQ